MGKNMTSGARRLSGNAVTLLITALLCGGPAALIYSGAASRQISNMLISMACYIVMAVSLNLVVGLLGELSLGHAGFMSVGLFTGCLLSIQLAQSVPIGVRMPLSMLLGGVAAAVVGLLVGLPALRLKGDYLAIVTLACGEIIKTIINNLSVTGGAKGLDTSAIYADTRTLLPFAIVLIFLVVLVMMNLKNSRHGRAIMAIRDNRIAAESNGVNVTYYKLMVFVLAAFSALRLAKFNIDETQHTEFCGLPTPANALFFISLGWIKVKTGFDLGYWLLLLIPVMSWLLVSPVRMFAFKFQHFAWKGNGVRYVFIVSAALLLAVLGVRAVPVVIVLYIATSVVRWLSMKAKGCGQAG